MLLDRFHPEDRQRVAGAVEAVFADGSAEVEARGYSGAARKCAIST